MLKHSALKIYFTLIPILLFGSILRGQAIKDMEYLESITFYEITLMLNEHTFDKNSKELNEKKTGFLSTSNSDFSGWPGQEFFDVYYSDANGEFNATGAFITIDIRFNKANANGGGGNISGIRFNFNNGKSILANHLESFVSNGSNYTIDSELYAVDCDLSTYSSLGNNANIQTNLRLTVGIKDLIQDITYEGCENDGFNIAINGKNYNENNPKGLENISNPDGCDSLYNINLVFSPCDNCVLKIDKNSTVCSDNGTPNDPSDDIITVSIKASAKNNGASNQYTVNAGTSSFGPYNYDQEYSFTLTADGSTVDLIFVDVDDSDCTASVKIGPLSPCSTDNNCELSILKSETSCSDNGTPNDPSDDIITITTQATAKDNGTSNQYTINAGSVFLGPFDYNKDISFQLPADGSTITLIYQDLDFKSCGNTIDIGPLSPCSKGTDELCKLYVPNVFTPNDDGLNDVFKVYFNSFCSIEKFEINIYDRWGDKVFHSTDQNFEWNGIFKKKSMNPTVFVWHIT